jgi:alpha/beta superfamily hydrolase
MRTQTERRLLPGAAGQDVECLIDRPDGPARGCALLAHPHPLFGGSADNKVVQTLARALLALGWTTLRPNFRGVGGSQGRHDEGRGEADDLALLAATLRAESPGRFMLGGFSFGAALASRVHARLAAAGEAPDGLVLVGLATRFEPAPKVPEDTLVVHGEHDDVVPLGGVLDWARPQALPVVVLPGAGHFFHGQLPRLKALVQRHFATMTPGDETRAC